jgi:hypothetical protein
MHKKTAILLLVIIGITITVFSVPKKWVQQHNIFAKANTSKAFVTDKASFAIAKKRAKQLKTYLQKNGYSDSICFMVNMAIPSGKPRFFVYDLQKDTITKMGLVTHGSGSENEDGTFVFKNIPNSLASSKGKYKIGESYNGKYGLAFKLYGLDSTNNKAFERFVVLHSHDCVPTTTVYPQKICVSWGCPTVAPSFLQKLNPIITKSSKPILLDIQYTEN